jgi:hypothetical protein
LEGVFMVRNTFRTQFGYFFISPHKSENEWCQNVTPFWIGSEIENFLCIWIIQCFVEEIFISQAYSLSLYIQWESVWSIKIVVFCVWQHLDFMFCWLCISI